MTKTSDYFLKAVRGLLSVAITALFLILFVGCNHNASGGWSDTRHPASNKPTLYIIGDSTVNSSGQLRGWGNVIGGYFDPNMIEIKNLVRGGRSSRTYQNEGLWAAVLAELMPGDYVLIQFGHNDGGSVTTTDNRASLKGIGPESQTIILADTGQEELVLTYGAYMRKYITDTLAQGAIPIVCSSVPRNMWNRDNSLILRNDRDYGLWAREVAESCNISFINLNELTALKYEKLGKDYITREFFPNDRTHTNIAGARVNAESVVEGLKSLKQCNLKKYLK